MDRGSWHFTEGGDQNQSQEEKCKKAKWLFFALQIAEKKREVKSKWEKERYIDLNECSFKE